MTEAEKAFERWWAIKGNRYTGLKGICRKNFIASYDRVAGRII